MDDKGQQEQGISRRALIGAGMAGIVAGTAAMQAEAGDGSPPNNTNSSASQPAGKAADKPGDKPAGKETVAVKAATLAERDITYRSGDATIKAFLVEPAAKAAAAIILIHEIWGLNEHIREVARRFAKHGYTVLAPDLFSREGPPKPDSGDRKALMEFIAGIPDRRVVADLEAGIAYLKALPGAGIQRIGSVGFCMGGLYSYLLATKSPQLAAAVEFYGRIVYSETTPNKPESPLDLAPQLKCPLLCHFGEQDQGIPVADVKQLRERLKQSTQPWKINIYPGAGHAFFNDTRPSYNAAAAADAERETLDFFAKYLT